MKVENSRDRICEGMEEDSPTRIVVHCIMTYAGPCGSEFSADCAGTEKTEG